jgi:hypothetical protein
MKTEQCFCKSYSDDDHKIQDCTCGKCDTQEIQEWEKEFDDMVDFPQRNKLFSISDEKTMKKLDSSHFYYSSAYPESIWELDEEKIKSFISQKLKEQRREIVLELEKCKEDENIWDYIYALKKQI